MAGWSPEQRDAALYLACALFAAGMAGTSSIALYRAWGRLAVGPYAAGALASGWLALRDRRSERTAPPGTAVVAAAGDGWHWTTPRLAIFLVVLVGATLAPLSLEILWRTQGVPTSTVHVQPEVQVVETAGQRVAQGKDPYRNLNPRHLPPAPAGQPAYDVFNPYLPLMSVFGLARGVNAPPQLSDARVGFSLVTMLLVAAALALCRGPAAPRVLTLQAMTVLPTAALPLATGGDDLPIVALMLLGLVLLQRRRPFGAGVVLGIGAAMKLTAWPLAAIAVFAARDRDGRRTWRARAWLMAGVLGVMVPAVVPTMLSNMSAFVENVIRFPLGLAGVTSPAASPLLGHVLVTVFPHLHRGITAAIVLAGAVAMVYVLVRHTPRTPWELARLLGWAMVGAIVLAPSTRVGYALYPIDLLIWAWMLRTEERHDRGPGEVVEVAEAVVGATDHHDRSHAGSGGGAVPGRRAGRRFASVPVLRWVAGGASGRLALARRHAGTRALRHAGAQALSERT